LKLARIYIGNSDAAQFISAILLKWVNIDEKLDIICNTLCTRQELLQRVTQQTLAEEDMQKLRALDDF